MQPSNFSGQATAGQRHNLAEPLTSFVGREREIADVAGRLGAVRLLTLVGAGGVGKTRLARRVGLRALPSYGEGAWLVELAPLTDPATIQQAVAAVLGVRDDPSRDLADTLASAIRSRRILLILDNCEHLLDGVADLVSRLLSACSALGVLATSREPLGVDGETIHRVPSLAVPDDFALRELGGDVEAALAQHDAMRLFVERAQAVQDDFQVTEQNVASIAQICRRLDGIPLAIELAAARARLLTPQQIAARLDDRFRLLTDGSRVALRRQRTLRAAIDWSYDLLTESERVLLQRLGVFVGGCTLEAAEAVTAAGPDSLDVLGRLVDKSLVTVDLAGPEARYGLLETIREYALEKLEASGDAEAVRRRHADYVLALAERAEPALYGPDQDAWLDRLAVEHDNVRSALNWLLGDGDDPVSALRLAAALGWFWHVRSLLSETRWLETALTSTAETATDADVIRLRAKGLCRLAWIGRSWNDPPRTVALAEESLALYRTIRDRAGAARAQATLGMLLRDVRDYPRAYAAAEEGLAIAREIGDSWVTADALRTLASVLYFDRFIHHEAAIRLSHPPASTGTEQVSVPSAVEALANGYLQESLAICRRLGDTGGLANVLSGGGTISNWAWQAGDVQAATAAQQEALRLNWHLRDYRRVCDNLGRLSELANTQDQVKRAIRLSEAGIHLSERSGARPLQINRGNEIRVRPHARTRLGPQEVAAAEAAGRAMSLEQAIAYALQESDPFGDGETATSTPEQPPATTGRDVAALTPREREVAILVGRGYSNRRIAETLVIAEKTAEVHARNVREKLGLESRAQIAAWAAQRGLLDAEA